MIQRALQGEQVAAVRVDHQGKHRCAALAGRGGQGAAVGRDGVKQLDVARGQAQVLQADQRTRGGAQLEAAAAVGAEVDQGVQRPDIAFDRQGLIAAFGITVVQRVFMHQAAHGGPFARSADQYRHIVLDIDDEAAGVETVVQRVAVTVGGHQQAGEVQRQAVITQGFRVDAIGLRMIQRALQGEQVAAVRVDHQGEHRVTTRRGNQGRAVGGNRIGQRHTARGQAQGDQAVERFGAAAEGETAAPIGAEIDQRIQGAGPAAERQGLAAFGITVVQRVFMHQAANARAFARYALQFRGVVVDAQRQAAGSGVAGAVGDAVAKQEEQVVLVAAARFRCGMVKRGEQAELVGASRQIGELQGEYQRVVGKGAEGQTIGADAVSQRNALRADSQRRQPFAAPGEAADAIGAEAVAQGADDHRVFAGQIVWTTGNTTRQPLFIDCIAGFAAAGKTLWPSRQRDIRIDDRLGIGEFGAGAEPFGRETYHWVECAADLAEQHEGVAATGATRAATGSRAGRGGFAFEGRVDAGLNRRLQLLDVGQVAVAGNGGRRIGRRGL